MIPGIEITLSGQTYTVPPLNFSSLKKLQPMIESLGGISSTLSSDQIDCIAEIVQCAIARNYPDITKETILDGLDLGNTQEILKAILGASGLKPAGEAPAGK